MDSFHRIRLSLAALAATFAGCIVVPAPEGHVVYSSPPPADPAPYTPPVTTTTVVYYEEPAPPPLSYYEPAVVWYMGFHPVTPGYGHGWCGMRGAHSHNYDPHWGYDYYFSDGYYYFAGDPQPYGYSTFYIYVGHHPHSWGGWCYHSGNHRHYYAPTRHHHAHYRYEGNTYYYRGSYDQSYHDNSRYYDR